MKTLLFLLLVPCLALATGWDNRVDYYCQKHVDGRLYAISENGGTGPLELNFSAQQSGVGAMIQADGPASFTAILQVFSGAIQTGSFAANSSSGEAVYLGVVDRNRSITSVTFSMIASQGSSADFAIGTVNLGGAN